MQLRPGSQDGSYQTRVVPASPGSTTRRVTDMTQEQQVPSFYRGRVVEASYHDEVAPMGKGNPWFEALPPVVPRKAVKEGLRAAPEYSEEIRALPSEERRMYLDEIHRVIQPLARDVDLYYRVLRAIRSGLVSRNPVARGYFASTPDYAEAASGTVSTVNPLISTAYGLSVTGVSGMGKTTGVCAVMNMFPQVIVHREYHGRPFNSYQIVYLRLEAPWDGSVKNLCEQFFQEIDATLSTNYATLYGRSRNATHGMLGHMVRLSRLHGIGLIIVDELQHLAHAKYGGRKMTMDFLVTLVNKMSVPLLFVGTPDAREALNDELRQMRRASGQGEIHYDRIKDAGEFRRLLKALWRFQYTAKESELTDQIVKLLHKRSGGIPGILALILKLAQERAITSRMEVVNPDVIESAIWDDLKGVNSIINAYLERDKSLAAQVKDLGCFRDFSVGKDL